MGARWAQCCREEFRVMNLHLSVSKPERLLQPQWNIPPLAWLLYRVIMVTYTLAWCVYAGLKAGTPKWLIFYTHITYCLMGLYYLLALGNLAGAAIFVKQNLIREAQSEPSQPGPSEEGGSGYSLAPLTLPVVLLASLRLQWLLHCITGSSSLTVSFGFWVINYPTEKMSLSYVHLNMHIVNAMQTLLEHALSSTPVHLCHYLYLLLCGGLYSAFTLIYWAAGFTNIGGDPYIYKVLNFGEQPLVATLCILFFMFFCLPVFHFVLWNLHLLKKRLATRVTSRESVRLS
ncbi:protein rolling stone [Amia ocellicauda]|uniref:protein rolling stone n=1 Tax=Amia ocellicauda TaxID=2972642 RepID=UPI003463CFD9